MMPTLPLLFNIVLKFLARAIRQQEQIKGIQICKDIVKVSLFADNMILYLNDLKNCTQKLLDTINSFRNSRIQNQLTKISSLSIHPQ
jgi:hypothetical protein